MKFYEAVLTGTTPLLMHPYNIEHEDFLKAWRKVPENKKISVAGDDRVPGFTWCGRVYHDGKVIVMPSDNIMTMLREAGAKITLKGKETYKKYTQSGILLDDMSFPLLVDDKTTSVDPINDLMDEMDFNVHKEAVKKLGFELFVKSVVVGRARHIRVRPKFNNWSVKLTFSVIDETLSHLSKEVLDEVFLRGGIMCGMGDWRPSSPGGGQHGKFTHVLKEIKK